MAEMITLPIIIAPTSFPAKSQSSHSRASLAHFLDEIVDVSRVICLLPQDIGTGSDLLEKKVPLLAFTGLNAFLNHIVPVSVFHHLVQRPIHRGGLRIQIVFLLVYAALHYFVDYLLPVFVATIFETFFDDIAGELVVAESDYVAFDALDNAVLVFLVLSMLQNVLDHIVTKLVIRQVIDFSEYLV